MKLLVAIDSSSVSQAAIDQIVARPWPKGTEARVLNVVDTTGIVGAWKDDAEQFIEAETRAASALVASAADRISAEGIAAKGDVIEGYPSTGIVDYAKDWEADMIIIGSHGHGALARFLLGSTAKSVTHNAPCSVEIVRNPKKDMKGGMKLLLATDGSSFSTAVAQSIAARPWPEGTQVKVISVVEMAVPAIEPRYGAAEMIERMRIENTKLAEKWVEAAEQIVSGAGLKTSRAVIGGYAKAMIVDEAREWNADIVMLGSHGRRGITRLLMGSVSDAVAMQAERSVEIIREK
jgi:nucleotide-binding universal stress UspA family protein